MGFNYKLSQQRIDEDISSLENLENSSELEDTFNDADNIENNIEPEIIPQEETIESPSITNISPLENSNTLTQGAINIADKFKELLELTHFGGLPKNILVELVNETSKKISNGLENSNITASRFKNAYNYRYADVKSDLEFLSSWLSLEEQFIPLYSALRSIGDNKIIQKIYKMIYTGDIASLEALLSPVFISQIDIKKQPQIVAALNSIINIVKSLSSQEIFSKIKLLRGMKKADRLLYIEQLGKNIIDELSNYFSEVLLLEMKNNPGLLLLLQSNQIGLGTQMGLTQTRLTTDLINAEMFNADKNDMPTRQNFINLLTTLMYRNIISANELQVLMPTLDEDINISPQQDYAFVVMANTGASSDESMYDVLKWIESTEKIEQSEEIIQEHIFPAEKSKMYSGELDRISQQEGTERGKQIRTAQLLMAKDAVVRAWGKHIQTFHKDVQQIFPDMDNDKFVQFALLSDDIPIREKIIQLGKKSGTDLSSIGNFENEYEIVKFLELLNLDKKSEIYKTIQRLVNIISSRNILMRNCNINDLILFKELFAQKSILLDIDKLTEVNIPGIAKLWNESRNIAGREIMDSAYVGRINRSDILRAAELNPFAANENFKDAVMRKSGENLEEYKNRAASLLQGLIDSGELYKREFEDFSPLNEALKSNVNSSNLSIKAINVLLKEIVREETQEEIVEIDDDDDYSEYFDYFPELKEFKTKELENRANRKKVLEDLLNRFAHDEIGKLDIEFENNSIQLDPEFRDADLKTDSDISRKIIDIFRNYFNLPICSYELHINSPKECKINENGFKLDFTILADKLINSNGELKLKSNIILAGEIFGFDGYTGIPLIIDKEFLNSIKATNIKKYEELVKRNLNNFSKYQDGISSADNDIRIFPSEDGTTLIAEYTEIDENGNKEIREIKANLSLEYKLRSSYKVPYETFLAHSVGADTLFIPSFNPNNNMEVISVTNNIAQQLDELSIIWKSAQGQSKAWEIINSYSGQIPLEFKKYMGENISKPYSNNQLYLYTILTHFDLQNIIIPLYKADPIQFPIKEMCEYNKKYKELMKQLMTTNDYVKKTRIEQQLNMLRKSLKYDLVTDNYQKFLNGDSSFGEEYTREILNARNQILNLMNNPNISLKEISEIIFGNTPLFKRISVLNGANFHAFDSSIYQQRQQVASSRWWTATRLN